MLPDRIPKARIMTYDWNAQYQKGVSTMTLHAEAIRLIKAIHNERSIKVAISHGFTTLVFGSK
jgi:hypothetical protein